MVIGTLGGHRVLMGFETSDTSEFSCIHPWSTSQSSFQLTPVVLGCLQGLQVNKLLNRLLCIPLELQAKIFSCFSAMLVSIQQAHSRLVYESDCPLTDSLLR